VTPCDFGQRPKVNTHRQPHGGPQSKVAVPKHPQ